MIRLSFFGVLFGLMVIWEWLNPRREVKHSRKKRWPLNLGVVALNQVIIKLIIPYSAIEIALIGSNNNWGLLNLIPINPIIHFAIAIIILDLGIYAQHLVFHYVPVLWRFHRFHHLDQAFDFTTGIRFHPVEILISILYKFGLIIVFGISPIEVLAFEILLNSMAMFNHGNIKLPSKIDQYLRLLVVTPDMHRVHHSVERSEFNRNFGFNLSCWDRLFKTYSKNPKAGHQNMQIGQLGYQDMSQTGVIKLLFTMPFFYKENQ